MQTSHGVTDGSAGERLGPGARVFGILTSPRATFERVVADPRWLGILAFAVGVIALTSAALTSTDFARRAILDQQIASMESSGQPVSDDVYERMEEFGQYAPYFTFASVLLTIPIGCVILAGMLYGVGYGILGAQATFRQVLAVIAHAGVIFVAQQFFVAPLNYARESITSPATLAAFAPRLDDETFAYKLLSTIDLFYVWWVMILAIGLGVLWKRRTAPIAATLYATCAGVVLIIAVLRTNLGF